MSRPIDYTSTEIPFTADNLPVGPRWEADGACWEAEKCNPAVMGCEWRWAARNTKAIGKEKPEGPMTDSFPLSQGGTK